MREMDYFQGASGGVALDIESATLTIGDQSRTINVSDGDQAAVFELDLPGGPAHLQGEFTLADGSSVGSYYAYVRKV